MSTRTILIEDNVRLLVQGRVLLQTLDAERYTQPEPAVASSGIGNHVRHVLDFYDRFFASLETGRLDYDARERDERIESDPAFAAATIDRLIEGLQGIESLELAKLHVKSDAPADVRGSDVPWSRSSIERELQFLMSHTVHHYALIGAIMRLGGREPEHGFGVAPSTLRYWDETGTHQSVAAGSTAASTGR